MKDIKVINILKDGTVVEDMSTVTVPKEIVERVYRISQRHKRENKESAKQTS